MKPSFVIAALVSLASTQARAETIINPSLNFVSRMIFEQMPESAVTLGEAFGNRRVTTEKSVDGVTCASTIETHQNAFNPDVYECEFPRVTVSYANLILHGKSAELLMSSLMSKLPNKSSERSVVIDDFILDKVEIKHGRSLGRSVRVKFLNRTMSDHTSDIACDHGTPSPGVGELFKSSRYKSSSDDAVYCQIQLDRWSYAEIEAKHYNRQ